MGFKLAGDQSNGFFPPVSKPQWVPVSFKTLKAGRFDWLLVSSIIQEARQFELIMAKRLTRLGYLGPPRTLNPPAQGTLKPKQICQEYRSRKSIQLNLHLIYEVRMKS